MPEKLVVPESKDRDLEYFTTLEFKAEEAEKQLEHSPLFAEISPQMLQKPYTGCDLNQPIVPVSKEISYLLAVTGGGQGYAGNEKEGTLHLQRGVAKRVEKEEPVYDEQNKVTKIVATSYTEIRLNIVENSGKITQL